MSSTDIVGYTFQADNLCLTCMRATAVRWGNFDGNTPSSVEALLDDLARVVGVDRHEERSFDSGDFPKVIFDSQVEDAGELCGNCHEPLIG